MLDVAWEWDGASRTALLWVDGSANRLEGDPRQVQRVFEAICQVRDLCAIRGRMLSDMLAKAREIQRLADKVADHG